MGTAEMGDLRQITDSVPALWVANRAFGVALVWSRARECFARGVSAAARRPNRDIGAVGGR
jgi:hypothetical protein